MIDLERRTQPEDEPKRNREGAPIGGRGVIVPVVMVVHPGIVAVPPTDRRERRHKE